MTAVPPGREWTIVAPGLAVRHDGTEMLEVESRPSGFWVGVIRPGVSIEVRGPGAWASVRDVPTGPDEP